METKNFYKASLPILLLLFLGVTPLAGQIVLNAPVPADNPNLPGNSPWPAICAGNGGFNQYYAEISWAGNANADNEFILELSDANGDFTTPVELARVGDQNNNNPFAMEFAIPTDTRGQNYRMRVRSTSPAFTSPESDPYHMYYMDVTTNINISELGDGIPPGSVCSTGPTTLQVDNIPNPETYQYIWFRSGTEIIGEKDHTLNVTQTGMYYAFIDYGTICTGSGNTDSNIVDVTIGSTGQGIAINPPTETALCSGDLVTLSINTTDPSWNYAWYKDGTAIAGATAPNYSVDASSPGFEGDYQVEISATGICTERSPSVTITNADNFTVTRDNAANVVVLPSQPETLSVSTTAIAPSYQWYRNSTPISGATSATLDISQEGSYYVAVTQGGGSCPGTIKNSETTTATVPTAFEIEIDYTSSYAACVNTSTVLDVSAITAIMADNSRTDVTGQLENSFSYQWSRNGSTVSGQTSKSISLTDFSENGDYDLQGSLGAFTANSNTLEVQLLTNETLTITSTGTVYCSGADTITLSTSTNIAGETFEWQRDGNAINSTEATLDVDQPGTYRLVIQRNGCSLGSNEISITPLDPDLIALEPSGDVIFPEGTSRSVIASGGTAYRWLNADNVEIGIGSSIDINEEGTYTLIATIGNCEIIRQFNAAYLDTFKVPNVITPNADGFNDQWILPNSYANRTDVNVIIYDDKGIELLNEMGYQNNWPDSSVSFPKQNMVFYYIVKNANEILKQGTITVIR